MIPMESNVKFMLGDTEKLGTIVMEGATVTMSQVLSQNPGGDDNLSYFFPFK